MRIRRAILCSLVMLLAACGEEPVKDTAIDKAVVLELFTSKRCEDCVEADAFLKKLADNPSVIALACHVSTHDNASGRDEFALDECGTRQKTYEQYHNRGTFTPQVIVNGGEALIGTRQKAIMDAVSKVHGVKKMYLSMMGLRVSVSLLNSFGAGDYFLTLYGVKRGGENTPNLVTQLVPLGPWKGDGRGITTDLTTDADGAVLVVQETASGRIVGAGQYFKN
ncbi:MAG: DUF1223 domain-containing protein [Alphaproteobacteria bacterium]|nr:DUF1223 domain-containing protein [Alphaproteobacteria bacterium]